jgi:hypothetical protein
VVERSIVHYMQLQAGDILLVMDGIPCNNLPRCRLGARRVAAASSQRRAFEVTVLREEIEAIYEYRFPIAIPLMN